MKHFMNTNALVVLEFLHEWLFMRLKIITLSSSTQQLANSSRAFNHKFCSLWLVTLILRIFSYYGLPG